MAEAILHQHSATGATLYALVWNSVGGVWSTVTGYGSYVTANRADYAVPLTEELASAFYQGDSLADDTTGVRHAFVYEQLGGSPAEVDTPLALVVLRDKQLTDAVQRSAEAVAAAELTQQMLSLLSREDAGAANDFPIALAKIIEDGGSGPGTYDNTLHSLQAIAAAGGGGGVDVISINGSTLAADKLEAHAGAVSMVVIGTGSTTTSIVLSTVDGAAVPAGPDVFNRRVLVITSGALNRQAQSILDYDGSTGTLTLEAPGFTGAAANGTLGVIV